MTKRLPTMQELKDRFKKVDGIVSYCLKEFPETRGNDMDLILMVWELQGVRFRESKKLHLKKCFRPETITRSRRRIQETGLFKAEPFRTAQRTLLEMEHRKINRSFKNK